jgi:hypothetical protein
MRASTFSDDDADGEPPADDAEPSYAIEGFKLEFSDKVALTPVDADRSPGAPR